MLGTYPGAPIHARGMPLPPWHTTTEHDRTRQTTTTGLGVIVLTITSVWCGVRAALRVMLDSGSTQAVVQRSTHGRTCSAPSTQRTQHPEGIGTPDPRRRSPRQVAEVADRMVRAQKGLSVRRTVGLQLAAQRRQPLLEPVFLPGEKTLQDPYSSYPKKVSFPAHLYVGE